MRAADFGWFVVLVRMNRFHSICSIQGVTTRLADPLRTAIAKCEYCYGLIHVENLARSAAHARWVWRHRAAVNQQLTSRSVEHALGHRLIHGGIARIRGDRAIRLHRTWMNGRRNR